MKLLAFILTQTLGRYLVWKDERVINAAYGGKKRREAENTYNSGYVMGCFDTKEKLAKENAKEQSAEV